MIGDGHGQVGLATAAGAGKGEPTCGGFRKFRSGGQGVFEKFAATSVGQGTIGLGGIKGDAGQRSQVTVAAQRSSAEVRGVYLMTTAGKRLAKIWVTHWNEFTDPSVTVA